MTRIGVKTHKMRNLYVLVVLAPRCSKRVLTRRRSDFPLRELHVGDELRVHRKRLRVHAVETFVRELEDVLEHVTVVATRAITRKRARRPLQTNVVRMPTGDNSVIGQFIRYHVLVRVYGGDPDAWLERLRSRDVDDPEVGGDIRFVHWIRSRLRQNPMLMFTIRRMVESTPFWRAAALR